MASDQPAPDLRGGPINVSAWHEENKAFFGPPICNKLMHKDQLTVMFVGGPNTRTDFHLELGSEFFYQMKGNMQLPTVQRGKRKLVDIREGQMFLLPSRIPHSPQRPEADALGLVIERKREQDELDGLRWYTDFDHCEEVLYERYFHCGDLGRDLVPVVKRFKASEECSSGKKQAGSVEQGPFQMNTDIEVPDPIDFGAWLEANRQQLAAGGDLTPFPGHPDGEFSIRVIGGPSKQTASFAHETFFYQVAGEVTLSAAGREGQIAIDQGSCLVVDSGVQYSVTRPAGSIGLVITQDPMGNKRSD